MLGGLTKKVLTSAIAKERKLSDSIVLGFRFSVVFFSARLWPNPFDIRFQNVSGLGMARESEEEQVGGRSAIRLPKGPKSGELVLKRGFVTGSLLNYQLESFLSSKTPYWPAHVLVMLHDESGDPVSAWLLIHALPSSWQMGELDASARDSALIDTITLSYELQQQLRF